MNWILSLRILKCNLQAQTNFFRNFVNKSRYGLSLLRFFASKDWQMFLTEIKNQIVSKKILKAILGNRNQRNVIVNFEKTLC